MTQLGMKARRGWHRAETPSQAPRRRRWALLGTRLLHALAAPSTLRQVPAAVQPPKAAGPSQGLQVCQGSRGRSVLGTRGTAAAGADELSDELAGTAPSIWR